MRKIGGVWKIDVTEETAGNSKQATSRALAETEKIEQITQQVKQLKIKSLEELKAALSKSGIKGAGKPM